MASVRKLSWLAFGSALLAAFTLAAACAGDEAAEPGGATSSGPLVYANPTTFPDLDPSTGFSNENVVNGNVYETLTRYVGGEELVEPVLATSWKASDDLLTWTFELRPNVTFHDGTPFDAEAVKFSIERTTKLGQGAAFIWDAVKSIEVVDDLTVRFKLSYAVPLHLVASAGYGAWMMSPAAAKGKDNAWFNAGNDAGSGSYRITSYEKDQRIVLERFDGYWGSWREGQFDTVIIRAVQDATVRQQMIQSGQAHFTYDIPVDNLDSLDAAPDVKVVVTPAYQNLLFLLNTEKEPTSNKLVRQALSYSFPYETFIETTMKGLAAQSKGPIPKGVFGHSESLGQYTFDLDKARELLSQAGYGDGGFKLVYTFVTGDATEQQAGELWKPELAKLGIDLEVRPMAWEAQWGLAKGSPEKAQEVFAFYWWPTYVTPYDWLVSIFHSEDEPFFNLSYYKNPRFDRLIDQANTLIASDSDQAEEMFGQAQEILVDDAPAQFVFDQQNIHVVSESLKGYEDNPAYAHVLFAYELTR
jgi:peptide/nickel transport system substrate-binding protein